ncbi:SPOR domain-containing protein [Lysobacter solisilvae (ex Woo and Kim 2020)]|uniref:SPOR domain-containing protein n=1 Tax=Agrilutibacter terrestris TaxID=2865112 RepID=A0A7H0FZM1_9GAMM|nr:SPOR domain-containing protein [Lysobacter terrestris]QNP41487.1 SPOR domain-containing protein [Lysobacter terrestris]
MLSRALIVLLCVLNLGVAAWWIAHDPPPPNAAPQVPPGVARLQLVAERAPAAAAPQVAATTAAIEAPPAPAQTTPVQESAAATPHCFSFGPFASREAGSAAAAKLKPQVQALATREQASAAARGWRVYLPPLPSPEQAQAIAERIGAAGFSDFLVVREGAEANSIALGRYGSEQAARKRADALNAAGFAAQAVAVGDAAQPAVWLDVVAEAAFDPRRAQASIAAAQHRRIDCPASR